MSAPAVLSADGHNPRACVTKAFGARGCEAELDGIAAGFGWPSMVGDSRVVCSCSEAAAVSVEWAAKLSVFWTDRHFELGRFPPLDRIDYIDNAVVLIERERVQPIRPALEEVQHYLSGAPFANWTEQALRFANR